MATPNTSTRPVPTEPARATATDTARVLTLALAPIVAQGVIARRRRVVALAGKLDTDGRGVAVLQDLRDRYGPGPVRLRIPGRPAALVLDPGHVRRTLTESPDPFAPDSWEKRGALRHLQPHGVLISHGSLRAERRVFNEAVLDTGKPLHEQAGAMTRVVHGEASWLGSVAAGDGALTWDTFIPAWWRTVRRIVLGDGAREDHRLTDDLTHLRNRANWSGLVPQQKARRDRFRNAVRTHLDRAEPGSLAAMTARNPADGGTDPVDQVPQWLFAYDPAGAVAYRALALLTAYPDELARVRAEIAERDLTEPHDLPRLRAAILESVRLWPTTPLLLRDTTVPTTWGGSTLPAGTAMIIPTWFLHRDDRTRDDADRFHPEQWLDGSAREDWSLVPFSAGPAACPGRELVLFTASTFLAVLLRDLDPEQPAELSGGEPLPKGLDPFALRFPVRAIR
jgi:cytochrome P450